MKEKMAFFSDDKIGFFPSFPAYHGITTRPAGDFSFANSEKERRASLALMADIGADIYQKIHAQQGGKVIWLDREKMDQAGHYWPTDGLLVPRQNGSRPPRVALMANTADCPIVFLADVQNRFIGLLHCGWQPLRENIIKNAFAELYQRGIKKADDVLAAIWPGICAGCYKVGPEFKKIFPKHTHNGRISLSAVIASYLNQAGVKKIFTAPPEKFCSAHTIHNGDFLFFSHRRDKVKKRNVCFVTF